MIVLTATAIIAPIPVHGKKQNGKKQNGNQPAALLVAQGHTVFLSNCSPCHGADAEGDDGPNLHGKHLSAPVIRAAIQNGFKNEMPPFGGKIKHQEEEAVVAYVHSLQK